jgi:hypothetical protein
LGWIEEYPILTLLILLAAILIAVVVVVLILIRMRPKPSRQQERVRHELPCAVTWDSQQAKGKAIDLSPGGARIMIKGKLPAIGTMVIVTLTAGTEMKLSGRVVHRQTGLLEPYFGVAFDEVGDHADFLKYLARETARD